MVYYNIYEFSIGDDDVSFYAVFDGHGGSKCSQYYKF